MIRDQEEAPPVSLDATAAAPDEPAKLDRPLLVLSGVVVLGAVASTLDTTVVSVAIDSIGRQYDATPSTTQWISTSYLLAIAVAIPVTGWAVERFGQRRMWMTSLALFLGASAMCGLAWSVQSLVFFRVLQGLGGGMIAPLAQTILADAAGPRRIGRVMTLVSIPTQLAPIVGPTLGGAIVDASTWRWIFYVNVPVSLLALALARRHIPVGKPTANASLDLLGLLLLSPGLAVTIYGLSEVGRGGDGGFTSSGAITPLAVGVALLVGFVYHGLHTRAAPIIDPRLFAHRPFATVSTLMFLLGVSLFGLMFLLPLYYQQAEGRSALGAGLLLAPQGAGTVIALAVVGSLTDRFPPRPLVLVGMTAAVVGTLPYTQVSQGIDGALLGTSLVLRGIGLGTAAIPLMAAIYQRLHRDAIPRATSAINVIQRIGGSFGTAVLAVILQRETQASGAADDPTALAAAYGRTFWWTVGFALVALVPAWFLPRRRETL